MGFRLSSRSGFIIRTARGQGWFLLDRSKGLNYTEAFKNSRALKICPGNGDSHLKRILAHHQAMIPVTKGWLDLGPWERIFYLEADGRRRKRVVMKVTYE